MRLLVNFRVVVRFPYRGEIQGFGFVMDLLERETTTAKSWVHPPSHSVGVSDACQIAFFFLLLQQQPFIH